MKDLFGRLLVVWDGLMPRERVLVGIAGGALAILLLFVGLVLPIQNASDDASSAAESASRELEMMVRMHDAWMEIDDDREIRAAILTGAGGTFSSGADLKLMHGDQSDNPWHARFREDGDLHWKALLRS